MAQLVVRNLDDAVKEGLRRRATQHGRSMEEEVRAILRDAVEEHGAERVGLGTRIARRFAGIGFEGEIPEWRGEEPRAATFED